MISRIPVAIAAAVAVSALALSAGHAQDSGSQTPTGHARAQAGQGTASTATAGVSKSQGSYSIGLVIGSQLPKLGIDPKSLDFQQVEQGFEDVISRKAKPTSADQQNVQQLVQQSKSGTAQKSAAASHSLGLLLGGRLPQLGLEAQAVNFPKLAQGLQDAMSGKVQASQADVQNANTILMQSREAVAQKNEAAAKRFLAANAKRPGVKTTKSGLQYKVLSPGSGASPHPTDQVTVNYRGTLLDGTEFDSSYARGMPATFDVNGVIPGWTEALGMMKPGAKWQLFIPPDLAYGANPPPQIPLPPNSLLKFEVELLKVGPPSASPAGAAPNVGGGGGPGH